jgi:hypothetical protein
MTVPLPITIRAILVESVGNTTHLATQSVVSMSKLSDMAAVRSVAVLEAPKCGWKNTFLREVIV